MLWFESYAKSAVVFVPYFIWHKYEIDLDAILSHHVTKSNVFFFLFVCILSPVYIYSVIVAWSTMETFKSR